MQTTQPREMATQSLMRRARDWSVVRTSKSSDWLVAKSASIVSLGFILETHVLDKEVRDPLGSCALRCRSYSHREELTPALSPTFITTIAMLR